MIKEGEGQTRRWEQWRGRVGVPRGKAEADEESRHRRRRRMVGMKRGGQLNLVCNCVNRLLMILGCVSLMDCYYWTPEFDVPGHTSAVSFV